MSSYYHFNPPTTTAPSASHSYHGGRHRKVPRLSVSQNSNRQFRAQRNAKEAMESAVVSTYRTQFENSRSFDLEDDMEFCPKLLTDNDLLSISSGGSDRSSLSSNSPNGSPIQQTVQHVAASFSLNLASASFVPPHLQAAQQSTLKLHQPAATRTRNAIPIINPANGLTASPPPPVSPSRAQQAIGGRW